MKNFCGCGSVEKEEVKEVKVTVGCRGSSQPEKRKFKLSILQFNLNITDAIIL